jgi:pentatricopeptide repeat protein
MHDEILAKGLLGDDVMLTTTLVDMYAKCGVMEKAEEMFSEIRDHDMASWNSLISGYALKGQVEEAMHCFKRMQMEGFSPDAINFLCLMNACSHSGLVEEGETCFMLMNGKCKIIPDLDHYTCMVDLFGRAGIFEKAIEVIMKMPSSHYFLVWDALLGACQKWGNVMVGRFAFEQAVQLNPDNGAAYVLMSNIYVAAGLKEDAEMIEVRQNMQYGME